MPHGLFVNTSNSPFHSNAFIFSPTSLTTQPKRGIKMYAIHKPYQHQQQQEIIASQNLSHIVIRKLSPMNQKNMAKWSFQQRAKMWRKFFPVLWAGSDGGYGLEPLSCILFVELLGRCMRLGVAESDIFGNLERNCKSHLKTAKCVKAFRLRFYLNLYATRIES
jgi:hypothetical protein